MRVSLFGYGKTTKALEKKLKNAIFYDDKCHKPFKDENGFEVRPSWQFDPNYSDLEIPSPGIPPSNELIQKARHLQSEYDFFAGMMPRSIWISGTNGKTTTTQMTAHLLGNAAQSGGNIGTPLADMDTQKPLWVLETSSFTLHYTNIAKPDIYVLLPIKPDHLDWHGGMEAYEAVKLKPLSFLQEGEVAIVPKKYENTPSDGYIIGYEGVGDLSCRFGIDTKKIKFSGAFLLDALLAMAVDKILFDQLNYDKINAFTLDSHRQEEFKDTKGRLWVNDTKATNIDATIACVENYKEKKLHLILGGDDKGVELDELFEYLKDKNVVTYHIGSNTKKLDALAKSFGIESYLCEVLEKAIERIDQDHDISSVAILSPAAASLDQFCSYVDRGERFKSFVHSL